MLQEKLHRSANGYGALAFLLGLALACVFGFFRGAMAASPFLAMAMILGGFLCLMLLKGLFVVNPNEGRVLQLFGSYIGTVRDPGLRWTNPFYSKAAISLRARNFNSDKLKVNDKRGNPIEIAAVVVWKVQDTAQATFDNAHYRM